METFYSINTAAARLDCHAETLRRIIRRGELLATKVGSTYRIRESDLQEYLAAHSRRATNGKATRDNTARDNTAREEPRAQTIAQRLAAIEALPTCDTRRGAAELDLSGERADVYGYSEREAAQL